MKTHQEIREAIEHVRMRPLSNENCAVTNILHALNDRIDELEAKQQNDYRLLADEIQGNRHYNP